MDEIKNLLIFSATSILVLFFISKILGKKQVAQLEFIDYVIGISIGSIAAEMATDISEKPFYYYIIAMAMFLLFDLLVTYLGKKVSFLRKFLNGSPLVIITQGKIDYKNLKKSRLNIDDFLSMCRNKGYFDITQIEFAIFENNGDISIIPMSNIKNPTLEDLKIKVEQESIPIYLIKDGVISKESLQQLQKDKKWLMQKLKMNKKQLKQIILAKYDDQKDEITLQLKE